MTSCPVCSGIDLVDTIERARLPAMQNYVYRSRESALAAPYGRFVLAVCRSCGFAWNREFDPRLIVYDEGYDNAVASTVMQSYYAEIVNFLAARYPLLDGLVVDVGCGDGRFLRALCGAVAGCRGLGLDPALQRDRLECDGRVTLLKAAFSADAIVERPTLVVSRHVLEHIPQPVAFLQEIGGALTDVGSCPCFFEVPDLTWIVEHGAFWDFSYEHCNYFTKESFAEALWHAGLAPAGVRAAFGSQYLWLEADSSAAPMLSRSRGGVDLAEQMREHAVADSRRIDAMRRRLLQLRRSGSAIAVWGMATKGVLFSILLDPDHSLIDHCVDANENKQGCFVPLTGHRIDAPRNLVSRADDRPLAIVVMNENYRREIESTCAAMGLQASYLRLDDASVELAG